MEQKIFEPLNKLYEENPAPLFGFGEKMAQQMPNELKYWINGYLFYKRFDGKFFVIETDEEYKKLFAPNTCVLDEDFDFALDEMHSAYIEYINTMEKLSSCCEKYDISPVSFEVKAIDEDTAIMADIVFVINDDSSFDKKYFVVDDVDIFYNINHITKSQINTPTFKENTLANPHHIIIANDGNVSTK
ncbi:MAG: hypothetical protein RSC41_03365 [Oscillospiraceae bacterium]